MGLFIISFIATFGCFFLFKLGDKKDWDISIWMSSFVGGLIAATVLLIVIFSSLCGASAWTRSKYDSEYTVITKYFNTIEDKDITKNPQLYVEMIDRAKDYNKSLITAQEAYDSWWFNWTSRSWTKDFNLIDLPKGG